MALLKRTTTLWLLRSLAALTLAVAAVVGVTGQALAHDDDDGNQVVTYGPTACTAIADLPAYGAATCVKHKTEVDDGVTETKNSYLTADPANSVRLSFEQAFVQNGWTIVEAEQDSDEPQWEYTAIKGQRRVKVKIEAQEPDEGNGTEFSIEAK
jgi:hypothetical protein